MLYNTYGFGEKGIDQLSRDEVLHVLNLARLLATDAETEKNQVELKKMIDQIDKIKDL